MLLRLVILASIDAVWSSWKIAKLKKTVTTAKVEGILNMAHLSTDGTKEKANASKTIIEQHTLGDDNDKEVIIDKLDKAEEELNKSGRVLLA